jgi:HSP20 family protein
MRFWNTDLDDWIRHFDESVSTYTFRTSYWYDNNGWCNEYSEFHDIIEWYEVDVLEKDLLEEEFLDILYHNKQERPKELVKEEYQTMPEEQMILEPFISYYYCMNAIPDASNRRIIKIKKSKRSPNHRRSSSYVNDDSRTFVYPEPHVLYREEVVGGERDKQDHYPLEIVRFDDLIKIITQTPLVDDKNYIKVKIYNDTSIEISVDDDTLQKKKKKYYRIIEVPKDADIETAKCTYKNGILAITFKQNKSKRK